MSANNWAVCPVCLSRAVTRYLDAANELSKAYGVVNFAEFDALRNKVAVKGVNESDFQTFREDWEIYGADVGSVTVAYYGVCGICGSSCKFTSTHEVKEGFK